MADFIGGNSIGGDAANVLPTNATNARQRLLALRQRADDLQATSAPLYEKMSDLRAEKHRLDARIRQLTLARGMGGDGLRASTEDEAGDLAVVDAEQKSKHCAAELKRTGELIEARAARSASAARLVERVEAWLRSGRPSGTMIAEHPETDVANLLKRGESIVAALDRHRRRRREHEADRHRTESASLPKALAKPMAREQVNALAARGEPDVSPLVEIGEQIRWPVTRCQLSVNGAVATNGLPQVMGLAQGEVFDALAMFAWLHRDALIAKLESEIDDTSDDANALAPAEREIKLAEIVADRLATERNEAALIWQALAADMGGVDFRDDTDPRAVLGVELVASLEQEKPTAPFGEAARAIQHTIDVR